MTENEQKNLSSLIVEALRVKGINVEKLALLTGISERPLLMLIEEKWDKLPPAPYVHGYLMKIGEVLGLDGKKLWAEYLKDNTAIRRSGREDQLPQNRFALPKWNKKFIWLGFLAALIVIYGATRIADFYRQPKLHLNPLPERVQASSLVVSGQIDSAAQLTLNNIPVYSDKSGNFEKEVTLQPEFNTLIFAIKKPLGKTYTVTKQIFYETPMSSSPTSTLIP